MTVLGEAYKSHSSSIMSEKNVQPEARSLLHLTRPLLSRPLGVLLASWLPELLPLPVSHTQTFSQATPTPLGRIVL